MEKISDIAIIHSFYNHIEAKHFPCIAAKAALAKEHLQCMVASHMACPHEDEKILQFLYHFVDSYRYNNSLYQSAAIIFRQPAVQDETTFEQFFWQRLQALTLMDARKYHYDKRVSADPADASFSYSLKEESFFIIGMHPASSRPARRFMYPVIIFNPHAQFEALRNANRYEQMKQTVRKRDVKLSGSVNPMLKDFGELSEVFQYSGKKYEASWQCPLKIYHE